MNELAQKVLSISTAYLGPASKMFLARQTKYHMQGLKYEELQKEHLPELSKWIIISGALVIDKNKAEELAKIITNIR